MPINPPELFDLGQLLWKVGANGDGPLPLSQRV